MKPSLLSIGVIKKKCRKGNDLGYFDEESKIRILYLIYHN